MYEDEIKSAVTYLNGTLTITRYSSGAIKASKILSTTDNMVKIQIKIDSNRQSKTTKGLICAKLLSENKYCYMAKITSGYLTSNNVLKHQSSFYSYWKSNFSTCSTLPHLSSQSNQIAGKDKLYNGSVNLLVEVYCMKILEHRSEQRVVPAETKNVVEMTHVWTLCDLLSLLNDPNDELWSIKFPSNKDLSKFYLRMFKSTKKKGCLEIRSCADKFTNNASFPINSRITIKNNHTGFSAFAFSLHTSKINSCWAIYFPFDEVIRKQCLVVEYNGVYTLP